MSFDTCSDEYFNQWVSYQERWQNVVDVFLGSKLKGSEHQETKLDFIKNWPGGTAGFSTFECANNYANGVMILAD